MNNYAVLGKKKQPLRAAFIFYFSMFKKTFILVKIMIGYIGGRVFVLLLLPTTHLNPHDFLPF